ncbi:alpha/beta fold hydrolase [Rhodovibrionaceae bacterium A322]
MTLGHHLLGSGPEKIIFLHGWLSDHQVYQPLFELLDHSRYTAAFADYRGYGLSKDQSGGYSIAEIAGDVIDLAAHLGWDRCHLVGHSMGGMVLQKVAKLKPELVHSAIALTPVPASGLPLDEETAAFFRSAADDDAALAKLFDVLTGERYASAFPRVMAEKARQATQRDALLGYMAAWTGTDFSQTVGDLQTRITVIAGAHDGAVGPEVMKETYLKQLPNAELKTLAGAGHYPAQETPAELFTLMEAHFSQQAGAA